MSHGEKPDTCRFGHVFDVHGDAGEAGIRKKIRNGKLESWEEVEEELGTSQLVPLFGDDYKKLKVSSGSQGLPYTVSWVCADEFDESLDYTVSKITEDIFIAPESNLHQEFMQRKQQAEQRVNQTLSGLADVRKEKHMLEHDIRKLRSRVEALNSGKEGEIELKADFVELVDGAGGGAQQGSEEAPLKTLRDQNIYPSIVADFYEMRGVDDLEDPDDSEFDEPRLNQVPQNEKAILKKKWVMYEKWKDLYGSEVKRKLEDLKGQLKNIERSIEETKNNLEPYVRDLAMINPEEDTLFHSEDFYPTIKGTASMRRDIEFLCYKPIKKQEYEFEVVDESEATHYRIVYIFSVHVNLAGGEQPNSPAQGPSSATIMYKPAIVCEHVFENILEPRMKKQENRIDEMIEDYAGDFEPDEDGLKIKEAREEKEWSVRKLREKISEQVEDDDVDVPIELSAHIRRLEDGMERPAIIANEYSEEVYDAMLDVLELEEVDGGKEGDSDMIEESWKETWMKISGQYAKDPYTIAGDGDMDPLGDLKEEIKFQYYYDFKLTFGLHTMK